jgi:hypothetical protein
VKTTEELEAKVFELKQIGSPSALSKARELEWALGHDVEADEDADRITDALLKGVQKQEPELIEQIPEFARSHNLYTFSKQKGAIKKGEEPKHPGFGASIEEQEKYWNALAEQDKLERERTLGKSFKWEKLLGPELAKATKKILQKNKSKDAYDEGFYTKIPDEAAGISDAELIASLNADGKHRPLLDIDFPAAVIPSSTEGHCHLYIDKELEWKDYKKLLNVLADLGIIEHGYRGASLARGYSALRLPWIKKKDEEDKVVTQKF